MTALSKLPPQGREAAVAFAGVTPWPAEEWAIAITILLEEDPLGTIRLDQLMQVCLQTGGAPSDVVRDMLQKLKEWAIKEGIRRGGVNGHDLRGGTSQAL